MRTTAPAADPNADSVAASASIRGPRGRLVCKSAVDGCLATKGSTADQPYRSRYTLALILPAPSSAVWANRAAYEPPEIVRLAREFRRGSGHIGRRGFESARRGFGPGQGPRSCCGPTWWRAGPVKRVPKIERGAVAKPCRPNCRVAEVCRIGPVPSVSTISGLPIEIAADAVAPIRNCIVSP
jgi:hypothetical protein